MSARVAGVCALLISRLSDRVPISRRPPDPDGCAQDRDGDARDGHRAWCAGHPALAPASAAVGRLDVVGFGIALSFGVVHLLTMLAVSVHVSPTFILGGLGIASALMAPGA